MVHCPKVDKETIKKTAVRLSKRYLPVLTWAPRMTRKFLVDDMIGGFIVGVMIVPTCLSWASLAGIPLTCGLSAALVGSFSYGTFGQCGMLSVVPVAEITTLLISISGIPVEARAKTFQSIGVQVGILSVALSFMDGGKVIKTVFAKAVGDGYTCAAALLAISVQVKVMFNVTAPSATLLQDVVITTIRALIDQMTMKSIYAFLLFSVYCGYLIIVKRSRLPLWIPHQLIVVVTSTLVTWYFRLDLSLGLAIVRDIPSALSLPHFPPMNDIIGLGPYTLTVTMICFIQMYVIAQRVMPNIDPNLELFASGMTNFLCNIFSGMPVTNSFSCSSVLMEQRVHTPMTSYTAGTVLLITIVFLTRLGIFYYLPKQALAAIVVASVVRLVDFSGVRNLWRYSKKDAAVWVLTFGLTIFGGITIGVLSGIMLSLVLVVLRIARPRAVSVGFNMAKFRYGDLKKDSELLVYPNILMWRFDAPLYFVNAGYFQEKLTEAIEAEVRTIDVVLVTCGKVVDIDASALTLLPGILNTVAGLNKERPRRIILTDIHGRLEKVLLDSEALPLYEPEEYDRLSIAKIEASGKFPVVFKQLETAISFAQRYISEKYGNVDTAPYPNVAFLTDAVLRAAKMQDIHDRESLQALTVALEGDPDEDGSEQNTGGDADGAAASSAGGAGTEGSIIITQANGPNYTIEASGEPQAGPSASYNTNLLNCLKKLKKISTFTADRELVGVMGVIRHSELTPKQKKKIYFADPTLLRLGFEGRDVLRGTTRCTVEGLRDFFAAIEEALLTPSRLGDVDVCDNWRRVLTIVRSQPEGLKVQLKPMIGLENVSFTDSQLVSNDMSMEAVTSAVLIVKWGGVLTSSGISHAHMLGEKLFARFFAAGDISLRRLQTIAQNLSIFASDESRVIDTALVVANAIALSKHAVTKKQITVDDTLLKRLNPTTRRLLRGEYKYFEELMHIDTHATARQFFHISGFRELLIIPLLDRPIMEMSSSDGDDGDWHNEHVPGNANRRFNARTVDLAYMSSMSARAHEAGKVFGPRPPGGFGSYTRGGGGGGGGESGEKLTIDDYYTPIEVLHELRKNLNVLASTQLPRRLQNMPLSNHETLVEMCARYDTMLRNLLGAKRKTASPVGNFVSSKPNSDEDTHYADTEEENFDEKRLAEKERRKKRGGREGGDDVALDGNGDPELVELMQSSNTFQSTREPSCAWSKNTSMTSRAAASTATALPSPAADADSANRKKRTLFFAATPKAGAKRDGEAPLHLPRASSSSTRGPSAVACFANSLSTLVGPSTMPKSANGGFRYDVSDASTLRDYGSYDMAYNFDLLRGLQNATNEPVLRRIIDALERTAQITDLMARVGESVLEGVNSSKRFIIGSLVSGGLLQRICNDFSELALMDEWRLLPVLLERAQRQYMVEKGGVEQDVRNVLKVFKQIGSTVQSPLSRTASAHNAEPSAVRQESEAEREFRLRFPFIALPYEPAAIARAAETDRGREGSSTKRSWQPQQQRGCGSWTRKGKRKQIDEDFSFARFYFSSHLHVEGLLHCLFESTTIEGFSLPSKEELDMSQQLYMKHLIFKVFRRRNMSFTDNEVSDAFRKLHLLFRSDIDYDAQQRQLESDLSNLYHSMYYISMEVYLSLGDGEIPVTDGQLPLFTVHAGEGEGEGEGGSGSGGGDGPAEGGGGDLEVSVMFAEAPVSPLPLTSPAQNLSDVCNQGSGSSLHSPALATQSPVNLPSRDSASFSGSAGSGPSMHGKGKSESKAATVLTTPQAGMQAEAVQRMRDRVYRVTPMRRVHEGISINDFQRLVQEMESAARSQTVARTQQNSKSSTVQ